MIGIGLVGLGFMGMIHYLAYRRVGDARVVALASRSERKLSGDWTGIQGNFGPRGTVMDLSGSRTYRDFEQLLADPDVDLVDLCVPNDQHAPMAIRALEARKHVLVEKPIALTLSEADRMIDAARRTGRSLMIAHVLPFVPEFSHALDTARGGSFGRLRAAHLKRLISRPDWSADIEDSRRSGGPAIDLHIHDTHFVNLLVGKPERVVSSGVVEQDAVVHLATQYLYPRARPSVAISCLSGALSRQGRSFTQGFELFFESATLSYDFANRGGQGERTIPLTEYLADGTIRRPSLGSGDPVEAFVNELSTVAACVTGSGDSSYVSAEAARDALAVCLAEVESVRTGQAVDVR